MERFSIDNILRRVSFEQFKSTAERLESSLKGVRPTIQSQVLLTTNAQDYSGYGSLTILIPEVEEARSRIERHQLVGLSQNLWNGSYKTQLRIYDDSVKESYCIWLSNEVREPKTLFFYGQCLDPKSQRIFDSFKKTRLLQKQGDGYPKPSNFAVVHALSSLRRR